MITVKKSLLEDKLDKALKTKNTVKVFLTGGVAYTGKILAHDETHIEMSALQGKGGTPLISKADVSTIRDE